MTNLTLKDLETGDYILIYQVIEIEGFDNSGQDVFRIKGVYSDIEEAKKRVKELYNSYNEYYNRDENIRKYDNINEDGTSFVVNEPAFGGGTYTAYKFKVINIECEVNTECEIEI